MLKIENWKLTDGSLAQYGRHIKGNVFEFKELDRNSFNLPVNLEAFAELNWADSDCWVQIEIDLDSYTDSQIEEFITGYYYSMDDIKKLYGDEWRFITAEIIFEYESGLY